MRTMTQEWFLHLLKDVWRVPTYPAPQLAIIIVWLDNLRNCVTAHSGFCLNLRSEGEVSKWVSSGLLNIHRLRLWASVVSRFPCLYGGHLCILPGLLKTLLPATSFTAGTQLDLMAPHLSSQDLWGWGRGIASSLRPLGLESNSLSQTKQQNEKPNKKQKNILKKKEWLLSTSRKCVYPSVSAKLDWFQEPLRMP